MKPFLLLSLAVAFLAVVVHGSSSTTSSTTTTNNDVPNERSLSRSAQFMSLALFKSLFYSLLSDTPDSDAQLEAWAQVTEWGWERAVNLDQDDATKSPFILCDEGDETSTKRKVSVVRDAIGISTDVPDEELSQYFYTISNSPNRSCYMCSLNGTKAQDLEEFILQPMSFFLKLNSASVSFTGDEDTQEIQYAVMLCPGLESRDWGQWSLDALANIVGLIPTLVEVPEATDYKTNFLILQNYLQNTDPTFCDRQLINNVRAEEVDDYFLVTFDSLKEPVDNVPIEAAETCFVLWAFALAYAPEVCYIERRVPFDTSNVIEQWIGQSGVEDYRPFFDEGITGEGQIVAVSDTGLDLDNCYFRDDSPMPFGDTFDLTRRKVVQYVDFVNRGEVVDGHGTHVAGTIAGRKSLDGITNLDGMADGVAKDARLCFFDIGRDDADGRLSVPPAKNLLSPGQEAGARIHSASWGSSSTFYTSQDRDFDKYIYNDESFLIVVAAGNFGPDPQTVGSPANGKNVLTVGASTSGVGSLSSGRAPVDQLAGFSSVGPSMDKRIKPDIVAPGAHVLSAGSRNEPSCDPPSVSDIPGPGGSDPRFGLLSLQGTSMATPVVSGHCALLRQYFIEGYHGDGTKGSAESLDPSGTLIKATLINGAQPLEGYGLNEIDARQGFGRMSAIDSVPLKRHNDLQGGYLDGELVSLTNPTRTYRFTLSAQNQTCDDAEMSTTLVWADPPGAIGCLNCVLNDLDLFAVQTMTNGTVIEHFPNGGSAKDSVNNVERVRFKAAAGDSFVITVTADHLESNQQTYAIASVFGCLNHRGRNGAESSAPSLRHFGASSSWSWALGTLVALAPLLVY